MNIDRPGFEDIVGLKSLWREAFGDSDEFINSFFDTAFSPERSLAVMENGEVLAALYWFDCSLKERKIAYVYAVAVAKVHRGQGIGKELLKSAHRRLSDLGYAGAMLVPGDKELFRFYEKLGYRKAGYKSKISRSASSVNVEIRRISAEEYALLRRNYLPEGGIVQENENLKFLQRQAEMYAGDDFLLAARREGNRLLGIELLGNAEKAPEILFSLGCREGDFYTPGRHEPFAMYYPIVDKDVLPTYFGLAFD